MRWRITGADHTVRYHGRDKEHRFSLGTGETRPEGGRRFFTRVRDGFPRVCLKPARLVES